MSVDTSQFVLFLFIQQIHKISFKASLVSGGEEYPLLSIIDEHFDPNIKIVLNLLCQNDVALNYED
jgi:hypothetical protein